MEWLEVQNFLNSSYVVTSKIRTPSYSTQFKYIVASSILLKHLQKVDTNVRYGYHSPSIAFSSLLMLVYAKSLF